MKYGRIYTPFHNLGKEYRSAIKFRDGEKLIEIADATSAFYAMSAIAYSIDTYTTEATAEANIILNEIDNDIYSQIAQKTNTSRKDIKSKINRIMFMSSRSTKTLLAQLTRISTIISKAEEVSNTDAKPLQSPQKRGSAMSPQNLTFKRAYKSVMGKKYKDNFKHIQHALDADNIEVMTLDKLKKEISIYNEVIKYLRGHHGYWIWIQQYPEKKDKKKYIRLLSQSLQIAEGYGMFLIILPIIADICKSEVISLHDSVWMRESINTSLNMYE